MGNQLEVALQKAEEKKPKVDSKVYTTKNYNSFQRILGNRKINYNHLGQLKKSMKEHDLMIPIIVNEKLEVIDGQHRLQARAELGLPVYYVIVDGLGIMDTQKANANNKNWGALDFLNYYVENNYYHYKIFKQFLEKYQFNIQVTMGILAANQSAGAFKDFSNGAFAVKDLDRATEIAERLYQIEPYYAGFKRRSFVFAMVKVLNHEGFNFEQFMEKLAYQSSKMVDCTDIDAYLRIIEDIFNFKRKADEKIRFR